MSLQKLATHIEVITENGTTRLLVDGEEFPWYIHTDGITVDSDINKLPTVALKLLADHVTVSVR